jgi:flagellar motor switch protein FliM
MTMTTDKELMVRVRGSEDQETTASDQMSATSEIPWMMRIETHVAWPVLAELRVVMRTGVLLSRFTVRDLLAIREGQVFESNSSVTDDVPVRIGKVPLGWSEFEVLEQRMALRLTRLG